MSDTTRKDRTLDTARKEATARLKEHLGDDGTREAEATLLLTAATGLDRLALMTSGEKAISEEADCVFRAFVDRRLAGEGVYRILGRRSFHGLDLVLTAETLEPRDDTEALVDAVLAQTADRAAPLRFADLGTGTGAIGLALLSELPTAQAVLSDIAPAAIDAARRNADAAGFAGRCTFAVGDWCEALSGQFDFLVSNPPYIPSRTVDTLAPEVREHDPRMALDGGADGLDAYRVLLKNTVPLLEPNGFLALEIGYDQAQDVVVLADIHGWQVADLRQDLGGRDRAIVLRRKAAT